MAKKIEISTYDSTRTTLLTVFENNELRTAGEAAETSSRAVADRPRDASCLSVASMIRYVERNFRFRFTTAYK